MKIDMLEIVLYFLLSFLIYLSVKVFDYPEQVLPITVLSLFLLLVVTDMTYRRFQKGFNNNHDSL